MEFGCLFQDIVETVQKLESSVPARDVVTRLRNHCVLVRAPPPPPDHLRGGQCEQKVPAAEEE